MSFHKQVTKQCDNSRIFQQNSNESDSEMKEIIILSQSNTPKIQQQEKKPNGL